MFKVKDQKKLEEALELVVRSLSKLTSSEVKNKKRMYHGVEVHEIHVTLQGFPIIPTYTIYKDWLVVSYFPQGVHGYISRAKDEVAKWKPGTQAEAALKQLPQEYLSISYSDPRPSIKTIMSIAPLIAAEVNSFNPDINLDVGSIPNAQEATRHLFPNISVTTDDGKVLRVDTRASLALPFELTGIDTYAVFIVFGFARFAF
jgi:hypothetical protein